jgi:S1-C subfamily serine protease
MNERLVVASDPSKDVAVLFVVGTFSYLPLGDSAALERGQPVQVIGYPFGNVVDTLLGVSHAADAGHRRLFVSKTLR